jgi:hypothetical protein
LKSSTGNRYGFQKSFKKFSTVDQDASFDARLFSAMRGTALAAGSYASANLNQTM